MYEHVPEIMSAIVCYGPEDYRLEEVPVPEPEAGELLVRIEGVGICASDVKCFGGAPLFWGDEDREGYCQPPVIPGHEFSGRVVALGEGAGARHGVEVGDRIISEQIVPCGRCDYCQQGYYWMCERNTVYGFRQYAPGAMAGYMKFPAESRNHKLPESLSLKQAVYIEPLACAIHAVQRGRIGLDDVVVIAGCGPLGLGMVAAARRQGPRMIIALDLMDYRLELAREAGADRCLNPGQGDVVEEIRSLTGGRGCDVYIEASGSPDSVKQGLLAVRKLGRFVEFGLFKEPAVVDWTIIGDSKELDIYGSHLSPYSYSIAIEMLEKSQVPAEDIVTHVLDFADFRQGFELIENPVKEKAIKVVLKP